MAIVPNTTTKTKPVPGAAPIGSVASSGVVPKPNIPTPPKNVAGGVVGVIPGANVPKPAAATTTTVDPQVQQWNDFMKSQNELMTQLKSYMQPMQYDPNTDPQYLAMKQLYDKQAKDASQSAMEQLNSRGILNSSITAGEVANAEQNAKLQADAMAAELGNQFYSRQQDKFNNTARLIGILGDNQKYYDDRIQRSFDNSLALGDRTGSILTPELQSLYNQVLDQKKIAETQGISPEQFNAAKARADELRRQISMLGGNPDLVSSNINYQAASGNAPKFGVQTMASKQLDRNMFESDRQFEFAKAQQEWENNFKQGQFDWQKAQQAWENAFQEKNFEQKMKEAAAQLGYQWASLSQRDKEFVADMAFKKEQFEYQKRQDTKQNEFKDRDLKLAESKSNAPTDTLDKKTSSENYYEAQDKIKAGKDVTKATAKQYAARIKDQLSDSDYSKLLDWIDKTYFK